MAKDRSLLSQLIAIAPKRTRIGFATAVSLILSYRFLVSEHQNNAADVQPFAIGEMHAIPGPEAEFACTSPEATPWTFDGSCHAERAHRPSPTLHPAADRTCGFCGDGHAYLRSLRDELTLSFKSKCRKMVIYGAALGSGYSDWLTDKHILTPLAKRVNPKGCLFQFVDTRPGAGTFTTTDGGLVLVHIDLSKMPYEHPRRNVKVLKFSPAYLFPWAQRAVWMDAKLLRKDFATIPTDFMGHFKRAVEDTGSCVSLMGLPIHENTMATADSLSVFNHCVALVRSSVARPQLSDDIDTAMMQCAKYYTIYADESRPDGKVFHQEPMIDSAFMLFDMSSQSCRGFNGDLLCTWLNEVHCHSDRDQVSFTAALAGNRVQRTSGERESGELYGDQFYEQDGGGARVHVRGPRCHWYYGGPRCDGALADGGGVPGIGGDPRNNA